MQYANLRAGGVALAEALGRYRGAADTIVLGIVRGGVPLADEVARALDLPLDVVLIKRMFLRDFGASSAASVAGTRTLDEDLREMLAGAPSPERTYLEEALGHFAAREELCRQSRAPLDVAGKTVLLVDNGMRSGGTMRISIRAVRMLEPARVVAAVPTGSKDAVEMVQPLADDLICLSSPAPYPHVGMFYKRFDVGSEREIAATLAAYDHDRAR